jgi:hypothetical protein
MAKMTTLDIIQGFDFKKVESRIDLSVFLTNVWDNLSADDKFEIVQIMWDAYNEFIQPVMKATSDTEERRARAEAMTPLNGTKWHVHEPLLRDTAEKVMSILLDSYNIEGVNA